LHKKILQTGVKNFYLKFETANDTKITIQCQFVLGNYEDLFMELIWIKGKGFAVGFSIQNFDFEALMQNLLSWTGLDISIPWLTRMEMKFMVSTIDGGSTKAAESIIENQPASSSSNTGSRRGKFRRRHSKIKTIATKKQNRYTSRLTKHRKKVSIKTKRSTKTTSSSTTSKTSSDSSTGANADDSTNGGLNSNGDFSEDGDVVKFGLPSLSDYSILAGVKFQLTWQSPQSKGDCKGDSICEFIYDWLPDIQMDIGFNYTKQTSSLSAFAEISGTHAIKITEKLYFEKVGLQIGWGREMREKFIQLKAELKYLTEPKPLLFTGWRLYILI